MGRPFGMGCLLGKSCSGAGGGWVGAGAVVESNTPVLLAPPFYLLSSPLHWHVNYLGADFLFAIAEAALQ